MSDYDPPRCYIAQMRKARKDHKCCECRGIITKGETYEYYSGVWDEPASFKTCTDCYQLRKDYDSHEAERYEDFAPFGLLDQYVFESYNLSMMRQMVAIREKRSSKVPQWWLERIEDAAQ